MVYKTLKRTSFAIYLVIIAMIFIGSVSAAPVHVPVHAVPENMNSLDADSIIIKVGYQVPSEWIDPNGVKWGTPIRIITDSITTEIESTPASRDDQGPSILQTFDGDMWIAWYSNSEDDNDEIYYTIYNSSSEEWLAPTRLTDDSRSDRHPAIGQMQNGDVWIVWDRPISDYDSELYYTFTSDGGATWTNEVNLTNYPTAIDQAPSITRTADDGVWVSWVTDRDGNPEIYAMYGVIPFPIVVDVETDRDVYVLSEPVNVSITMTNNGPNMTSLFPTSQLADFNITNEAGQHIYQWSYNKVFSQEITEISINQSETIELLNDAWNLVDDDGNPVTPGNYYIDGWMVKGLCDSHSEINGERLEIAIYSGPRNLKRDAICGLEAINPVQKGVRHLIDASMGFITESLRDDLWINDTHLNPSEMPVGIVFDAEIGAVILLQGVQRWDPTIEDAVNDEINKLIRADELIVLAVIDDRDTLAKKYQDKAHECLSNGESVHAIIYFKLAWMHSVAQSSQDIPQDAKMSIYIIDEETKEFTT